MTFSARQWFRAWTLERTGLLLLFLAAFFLRFPLRDVAPYFDEGGFYYMSLHYWHEPTQVTDVYGFPSNYPNYTWFWERPLFYVLMSPFAHLSFTAYRVFSIFLVALVPVVAVLILRTWNVRRWLSFAAGGSLAVLPNLFRWGISVYMDPVMTLVAGVGILAWSKGRVRWAVAFLAGSVMIKMTSVLVLGFLLAFFLWDGLRAGTVQVFPLRLPKNYVFFVAAVPLALAPYLYDYSLGYGFPGSFRHEDYTGRLVESMYISSWLVPLLLGGLLTARTRRWSLLALLTGASFLYLHAIGGRNVEAWYSFLPVFLTLLAVTLVLDELLRRSWGRRAPLRQGARGLALLVFALFCLLTLVPASEGKIRALQPLSDQAQPSLFDLYHTEPIRDQGYLSAVKAARPGPGRTVFVVDYYFSHILHPVATSGGQVRIGGTWPPPPDDRVRDWADVVEKASAATLIVKADAHAMNRALRIVFAECVLFEDPGYETIDGPACAGRGAQLREVYDAQRAAGYE